MWHTNQTEAATPTKPRDSSKTSGASSAAVAKQRPKLIPHPTFPRLPTVAGSANRSATKRPWTTRITSNIWRTAPSYLYKPKPKTFYSVNHKHLAINCPKKKKLFFILHYFEVQLVYIKYS